MEGGNAVSVDRAQVPENCPHGAMCPQKPKRDQAKACSRGNHFQLPLRSRRRIIPQSPLPSRSIAALLGSGTKTGASVFPVKAFEAHIPSSLAWVPPPMNVTSSNVTSAAKDGAAVRINAIVVATKIKVGEVFIRALFEKFSAGHGILPIFNPVNAILSLPRCVHGVGGSSAVRMRTLAGRLNSVLERHWRWRR